MTRSVILSEAKDLMSVRFEILRFAQDDAIQRDMKINDIIETLEKFAPLGLQAEYDNAGLLVGRRDTEVGQALLCVDVSAAVLDEAVRMKKEAAKKEAATSNAAGGVMIISHHPLIFRPLRRLIDASRAEELVAKALKEGIAIYACHTNLDAAPQGMSWRLAQWLGLQNVQTLKPETGFGVIGELPQQENIEDFMRRVMQRIGLEALRHSEIHTTKVRRVALCTGAGEELMGLAISQKADIFLTADVKHHNFLDAVGRITIADIGHFESEKCAVELLCDIIRKKIPNFAVRASVDECNPVKYVKS